MYASSVGPPARRSAEEIRSSDSAIALLPLDRVGPVDHHAVLVSEGQVLDGLVGRRRGPRRAAERPAPKSEGLSRLTWATGWKASGRSGTGIATSSGPRAEELLTPEDFRGTRARHPLDLGGGDTQRVESLDKRLGKVVVTRVPQDLRSSNG